MNFSNLIPNNRLQDMARWLPALMWGGWILIAFLAAKTVWAWVLYSTTPEQAAPYNVSAAARATPEKQQDLSAMLNKNLFGDTVKVAVAKPVAVQENVADTRLNLKLRGIYAAETKAKANAIIEDGRGKQAVYFIDEPIKVGGRVYLRQVEVDRVILETNGRREALRLQKEDSAIKPVTANSRKSKTSTTKGKPARVQDKRENRQITAKLNEYRDKLTADPKSISEVISARPHVVDGELKGFKVRPGRDKRLFADLGLRNGDLVTAVNGVPLTNMQDAMSLMAEAQTMMEMSVDIQRGDQQLSLLLNLNQ